MKLTLNTEAIRLITLFENITGSAVKDCIIDEGTNMVCFLIEEGGIGDAIGKRGKKVKSAEQMIGRRIKLIEFSEDLDEFVRNMIPQATSVNVRKSGKKIVEVRVDKGGRALVLGRNRRNLKLYKELLKRNYHVEDLVLR